MRRTLSLVAAAGVLTLGLAGCGAPADPAGLATEALALQNVGVDTGVEQSGTGDAPRRTLRRHLRKNTLHGEVTVNTKKGTRTVVVQRGSVTAVSGGTLTVRSTDGYALTWKLGTPLRVVQNRKKADASALKAGARVGVAGVREGTAATARLVAVT